jgi:hypothetical protein
MVPLSAEQWNTRYPVGTAVRCWPGRRSRAAVITITAAAAFNLGDCIPVIRVEVGPGVLVPLTRVEPLEVRHAKA